MEAIDMWIQQRIALAGDVIADHAREKIKPGDVVLTYARCVRAVARPRAVC